MIIMESYRKTGIIVGLLFIIATAAPILSGVFLGSITDVVGGISDSDYLNNAYANENQVIIGVIFFSIMAVAVASIAIALYPILKKHNETLALGYVGARIGEGIFFAVNVVTILTLLTLSKEFVLAGSPDASYYQTLGTLLLSAGDWAYLLGFGLFFTISALILNFILYQSKLIPRWLSVWGFVGGALIFVYYLILPLSISLVEILFLPIAVQEMVFAVWIIVKGFNPQEIKYKSG
jgi:MFS family permease